MWQEVLAKLKEDPAPDKLSMATMMVMDLLQIFQGVATKSREEWDDLRVEVDELRTQVEGLVTELKRVREGR